MKHNFARLMFFLSTSVCFFCVFSCSGMKHDYSMSEKYKSLNGYIPIPAPSEEQKKKFNRNTKADKKTIKKETGKEYTGYVTENKYFFEEVMKPLIIPEMEKLAAMKQADMINRLALFTFETYRIYFDKSGEGFKFYRWGGDMYDLDDPQSEGFRYKNRYGLDCSGFASMPYDIAIYFGLMRENDPGAVFSSKGFEYYCTTQGVRDKGGFDGTSNNYRVDSSDFARIGTPLFSVEKNGIPKKEDVEKLQPGDIISGPGHVGIIVEIGGKICYTESGITTVGKDGERIIPVMAALILFAQEYPFTARRALPERK